MVASQVVTPFRVYHGGTGFLRRAQDRKAGTYFGNFSDSKPAA